MNKLINFCHDERMKMIDQQASRLGFEAKPLKIPKDPPRLCSTIHIVNDLKFTVNHAVEPMEKGFTRFNEKLHKISQNIKKHEKEKKRTKDDSCIGSSSPNRRVIRGIDDPLLTGSFSDSGARARRHRKKSGYTSAESGGESSSDPSHGAYEVSGRRWITKE